MSNVRKGFHCEATSCYVIFMVKRRRLRPAPLPKSWLPRQEWSGDQRSYRDKMLDGMHPRPGTKAHLRMSLLAAGWEPESMELATLELTRTRIVDVLTEKSGKTPQNVDGLATEFRKKGFNVSAAAKDKRKVSRWVAANWDAMCLNPWWLTNSGGQRSLFVVSGSAQRAENVSSLFIHDMWENLREEPQTRMPVFRRVNLVSLMSPDTLRHFTESVGARTDLMVVHGGFLDQDSMYQTFSHLAAVRYVFQGFLLYEAVVPQGSDIIHLAKAAKRSGFPMVLGA